VAWGYDERSGVDAFDITTYGADPGACAGDDYRLVEEAARVEDGHCSRRSSV
jgi:hypothetical protein